MSSNKIISDLKSILKYESEAFEEYYGSELDKDWLLGDLNDHKDKVMKKFRELLMMGLSSKEIRELIHDINKEYLEDVIDGQYWFTEPQYHPNEDIAKKEHKRLEYHKKFGWTLDILKEVDKLIKSKKLRAVEYSLKSRTDLPDLDEGMKEMISKYLRASSKKRKSKKKSKSKSKRKGKSKKKDKSKKKKIKSKRYKRSKRKSNRKYKLYGGAISQGAAAAVGAAGGAMVSELSGLDDIHNLTTPLLSATGAFLGHKVGVASPDKEMEEKHATELRRERDHIKRLQLQIDDLRRDRSAIERSLVGSEIGAAGTGWAGAPAEHQAAAAEHQAENPAASSEDEIFHDPEAGVSIQWGPKTLEELQHEVEFRFTSEKNPGLDESTQSARGYILQYFFENVDPSFKVLMKSLYDYNMETDKGSWRPPELSFEKKVWQSLERSEVRWLEKNLSGDYMGKDKSQRNEGPYTFDELIALKIFDPAKSEEEVKRSGDGARAQDRINEFAHHIFNVCNYPGEFTMELFNKSPGSPWRDLMIFMLSGEEVRESMDAMLGAKFWALVKVFPVAHNAYYEAQGLKCTRYCDKYFDNYEYAVDGFTTAPGSGTNSE